MCQWVETVMSMIDCHDVKSNFLKATTEHSCSCTNFNDQWLRHRSCIGCWLLKRLSLQQLITIASNFCFRSLARLIVGFITKFTICVAKSGGCLSGWTILVRVVMLEASTEAANMQTLSAAATLDRQVALVQIMIETNGISVACSWNSALQSLRHLNCKGTLTFV